MQISAESLVEEYGWMVLSISRRMIQDADVAQDAAQQVWMEIKKSLPGFRGEAKISTWISCIVHRVVLDHAKHERQHSTRFMRDCFRIGDVELPQYKDFDKEIWIKEMCDKCLTGMLNCLDPMEGLVKALERDADFTVEETLWEGSMCNVLVKMKK